MKLNRQDKDFPWVNSRFYTSALIAKRSFLTSTGPSRFFRPVEKIRMIELLRNPSNERGSAHPIKPNRKIIMAKKMKILRKDLDMVDHD